MKQSTHAARSQITRRNALRTSVAFAGGLAFGRLTTGTAQAKTGHADVFPVHQFVRSKGTAHLEPTSPMPEDDDKIVERREGNPVDDGTNPKASDGDWTTWGELSELTGTGSVDCRGKGTDVKMEVNDLFPNALYTAWVVVIEPPGFVNDRKLDIAFANLTGVGALGAPMRLITSSGPTMMAAGYSKPTTRNESCRGWVMPKSATVYSMNSRSTS